MRVRRGERGRGARLGGAGGRRRPGDPGHQRRRPRRHPLGARRPRRGARRAAADLHRLPRRRRHAAAGHRQDPLARHRRGCRGADQLRRALDERSDHRGRSSAAAHRAASRRRRRPHRYPASTSCSSCRMPPARTAGHEPRPSRTRSGRRSVARSTTAPPAGSRSSSSRPSDRSAAVRSDLRRSSPGPRPGSPDPRHRRASPRWRVRARPRRARPRRRRPPGGLAPAPRARHHGRIR